MNENQSENQIFSIFLNFHIFLRFSLNLVQSILREFSKNSSRKMYSEIRTFMGKSDLNQDSNIGTSKN